ncbi:MAG: hypothetical protein V3V08_12890 [Nannocystaceae bacterium]
MQSNRWTTCSATVGRNQIEDDLLRRLGQAIDENCRGTIVADRGLRDHNLAAFLNHELRFDPVIRFLRQVLVISSTGNARKYVDRMLPGGRIKMPKMLKSVTVTALKSWVLTIACAHDRRMKDVPVCLATGRADPTGTQIKKMYGRNFSFEEIFRDMKDLWFGMGSPWMKVRRPDRKKRIFLRHVSFRRVGDSSPPVLV